jgi:hypothetical protein
MTVDILRVWRKTGGVEALDAAREAHHLHGDGRPGARERRSPGARRSRLGQTASRPAIARSLAADAPKEGALGAQCPNEGHWRSKLRR